MNVKENISAKFGICKSGDLFLTRRSRRLRRTSAHQISMVLAQTTGNGGLYTSETKAGNLLEMNGNTAGRTLYEMELEISGLLDLTDAKVIEHLGTTFDQMKLVGSNAYEFTQEVAIWAKNNGYSGVKFYGAQSSTNYTNFVIFEQTTVNNSIKGTVNAISW